MTDEKYCGYVNSRGPTSDEVCGRPAKLVDRGDGTYLCRKHAAEVLDQQPTRSFGPIDRSVDRKVAELIFGFRVCERGVHLACSSHETHLPVDDLPWFAERPQEAERVVRRLRDDGIDLRANGVGIYLPPDWRIVFSDPEREPLAICVAALTARGIDF